LASEQFKLVYLNDFAAKEVIANWKGLQLEGTQNDSTIPSCHVTFASKSQDFKSQLEKSQGMGIFLRLLSAAGQYS
jgi:hypothetical protein